MPNFKLLLVSNKVNILIALLFLVYPILAKSVVNVDKTRVVFKSGDFSQTLTLHNSEKQPTLIQIWTDYGDPFVTPDKVSTPVFVSPSIFRMNPGEIRTIKIFYEKSDRYQQYEESIYWLNIYQIPPNTNLLTDGKHKLIVPLKIRLKVFLRPEGVQDVSYSDYLKVTFERISSNVVRITNPTKWYITLPQVNIGSNKLTSIMIPPNKYHDIQVHNVILNGMKVDYVFVDDLGMSHSNTGSLN